MLIWLSIRERRIKRQQKRREEQQRILRTEFCEEYGITELPASVRIYRQEQPADRNMYVLQYPFWLYRRQDGCRDARRSGNRIIWNDSSIFMKEFLLCSRYPFDIVRVVQNLRLAGNTIDLSDEEKVLRKELIQTRSKDRHLTSANEIYERYKDHPVQFEYFCARLFESKGYRCEVTSATNDGGYDISFKTGQETGIIECKCFKPGSSVSRPMIQKLVGANLSNADHLIFITTSTYTGAAMEYAALKDVELIDGKKLGTMIQPNSDQADSASISPSEYHLQVSDLKRYVPSDIFDSYFE